jgi:hypothetical protein
MESESDQLMFGVKPCFDHSARSYGHVRRVGETPYTPLRILSTIPPPAEIFTTRFLPYHMCILPPHLQPADICLFDHASDRHAQDQ